MKKLFSIGLALLLVIMFVLPASAEDDVQLATTKDFIRVLEESELTYQYKGMDSTGTYEIVTLSLSSDVYENCTYTCFFHTDEDEASIRLWNLITITSGKSYALQVINNLNNSYKWTKFYYDEDDSTLTATADIVLNATDPGNIVFDVMVHIANILNYEDVQTSIMSLK